MTDQHIDPNTPPPVPGDAPPADQAALEAFARRLGWRSEADFASAPESRRPKEYLTPQQYIEKVETEVPILRQRLRKQDEQVVASQAQINGLTAKVNEAAGVVRMLHENQKTIREREYKRARAEIEAEMDAAARTGDPSTYDASKRRLAALDTDYQETQLPPAPAPAAPVPTNGAAPPAGTIPEVEVWKAKPENLWFSRSVPLNQAAIDYEAGLDRAISQAERLEMTSAWVRENFAHVYPQHFPGYQRPAAPPSPPPPPAGNPRRTAPAAVTQPGGGSGRPPQTGLTYDMLSAEEKANCDYLVREVKGFTVEDFLRDYKRD